MAKLWAVAKREYFERVRSKWFVIATILGPVLMAAMIVVPVWLATRSMQSSRPQTRNSRRTDSNLGRCRGLAVRYDLQGEGTAVASQRVTTLSSRRQNRASRATS